MTRDGSVGRKSRDEDEGRIVGHKSRDGSVGLKSRNEDEGRECRTQVEGRIQGT